MHGFETAAAPSRLVDRKSLFARTEGSGINVAHVRPRQEEASVPERTHARADEPRVEISIELTTAEAGVRRTQTRHIVLELPTERSIMPIYQIRDEEFFLEMEDDLVYIRHPHWSLMGVGATLREAHESLLEEAGEIAEIFLRSDPASLTYEALRLRDFALQLP